MSQSAQSCRLHGPCTQTIQFRLACSSVCKVLLLSTGKHILSRRNNAIETHHDFGRRNVLSMRSKSEYSHLERKSTYLMVGVVRQSSTRTQRVVKRSFGVSVAYSEIVSFCHNSSHSSLWASSRCCATAVRQCARCFHVLCTRDSVHRVALNFSKHGS